MMKGHLVLGGAGRTGYCLIVIIAVLWGAFRAFPSAPATDDSAAHIWKKWLRDVDLIMTRDERSTAGALTTAEDRKRFMELFWKARDTNPATAENEYQTEFQRRCEYARKRLGSERSDRGRIYLLLGAPFDIERFSGSENLVDCEIWEYRTDGRHGLFPFMNILFFKQRDIGDFQLYHPGIHTAVDLLNPFYSQQIRNPMKAFQEIKQNSPQLADASLSIIPGEGEPGVASLSSSNYALSKIYTLPEREAESGYVRNFKLPGGTVEVSHTTNAIRGFSHFAVTRSKGVAFISYALMPDTVSMKAAAPDAYSADIQIDIKIEDLSGKLIFQNQRNIPLQVNLSRKQEIEKRKIIFYNAEPIIEGAFAITVSYLNKTGQEFFSAQHKATVEKNQPIALAGFSLRPLEKENFMPFTVGEYLVFSEPRGMFSNKETLEGVILTDQQPSISLISLTAPTREIIFNSVTAAGQAFRFSQPLSDVKDGKYRLLIKTGETALLEQTITIMPFYISLERPLPIVQPTPASPLNRYNFNFLLAQQNLNAGQPDQTIAWFDQIPDSFWNNSSIPVLARAFYLKKDYSRVMQLLERKDVEKTYLNLVMLANSAIELKKNNEAILYLEALRKYGDTPELNRLLAAASLSAGKPEKARVYYQRARELMNAEEKNEKNDSPDQTPGAKTGLPF